MPPFDQERIDSVFVEKGRCGKSGGAGSDDEDWDTRRQIWSLSFGGC